MTSATQATVPQRSVNSSGRILAIDYGRKRFGLAISDEARMTSRPLATLARTNRRDDLRRMRLLAREHEVRFIVVGLPLRLDGTTGEMAEEAKRFATRLAQHLGLPVEMMDERLTSWEAGQITVNNKVRSSRENKKPARDHVAAAVILRDYLAAMSETKSTSHASRKS
jgi:putative holliday junction resolvase